MKFTDEVTAVRTEVEKLKSAGVKIIIGLSHSGYGMDKKVAAEVDGIDVIVGGHSHTFLYTGDFFCFLCDRCKLILTKKSDGFGTMQL